MAISRFFVVLTGLVFLVYGLGFIVVPALLSQWVVGAVPEPGAPMTDVRATYGGLSVAVGVMLLLLSRSALRLGLVTVLLLMVCMAAGRAYGLSVDAGTNTFMIVYLILEAAAAAVAGMLLLADKGANAE